MMNIPRQAPPMMPKKLYLLPMIERPKGKEKRALTAKTCDTKYVVRLDGLYERWWKWGTYIEALHDEDGEVNCVQISIEKMIRT